MLSRSSAAFPRGHRRDRPADGDRGASHAGRGAERAGLALSLNITVRVLKSLLNSNRPARCRKSLFHSTATFSDPHRSMVRFSV